MLRISSASFGNFWQCRIIEVASIGADRSAKSVLPRDGAWRRIGRLRRSADREPGASGGPKVRELCLRLGLRADVWLLRDGCGGVP